LFDNKDIAYPPILIVDAIYSAMRRKSLLSSGTRDYPGFTFSFHVKLLHPGLQTNAVATQIAIASFSYQNTSIKNWF